MYIQIYIYIYLHGERERFNIFVVFTHEGWCNGRNCFGERSVDGILTGQNIAYVTHEKYVLRVAWPNGFRLTRDFCRGKTHKALDHRSSGQV